MRSQIVFVNFNRTSSPPLMNLGLITEALKNDGAILPVALISNKVKILQKYNDLKINTYLVSTPENILQIFVLLPIFIFGIVTTAFKIAKQSDAMFFCMTHPYNFIAMYIFKFLNPKIKVFCIINDAKFHQGEKYVHLRSFLQRLEVYLTDHLCTLSEKVRSELLDLYPDREIVVFPHGLLDYGIESKARTAGEPFKFGFLGRIEEYKGVGILLGAFQILKEKLKDGVVLIIAGKGDLKKYNIDIIDKNVGIKIINRYLEEDEVASILTEFDALVLPYTEASQSGLVPLALGKAIPIVATRVGGLEEQCKVGKFSILIEKNDQRQLAAAMYNLVQDENLYSELSAGAVAAQDNFSWKSAIEKILMKI